MKKFILVRTVYQRQNIVTIAELFQKCLSDVQEIYKLSNEIK